MYTSGSTGKPKGVMIEHASVVNLLIGIANEVDFSSVSSFLSVTTYIFDICYLEFYLPLVNGGKLFIISNKIARDGFLLVQNLYNYCPTHMQGTPSTWQLLAEAGWTNEMQLKMLIGGEGIQKKIKTYFTKIGDIWNVYGPTETTIWSSIKKLSITEGVTIGRPIGNTQIYILGPDQGLVPVGVTGEICIGGAGLARGYLNRPDLTAEKFILHPFSTAPDARIYRTGDLGRWLPDGNIEFLGRGDDQVKIRGYRIEPGEIESALTQTGQVQQAVVLCKEDSQGNKRLIAYVVPGNGYQHEDVLAYLRTKLPEYMVPGLLLELDSLPLTPNGKTDRKALLDIDISGAAQSQYEAPRNPIEVQLAAIWSDLLAVERIGIHDNFFELGGHSLLAMRLVSYARREMALELSIGTIFNNPTIALLAAYISTTPDTLTALPAILAATRPERIPLSFAQERLWFIDALEGSLQYHLPFVLRLKGELDSIVLEKALRTIVNRHEVLRTVIGEEDGQAFQHILDKDGWKLGSGNGFVYHDEAGLRDKIDELITAPFNLSSDYMIRGDLIKVSEEEHVFLGTMHHIISDGWSIPILVKELTELYNAFTAGRNYQLPELPVQYADYTIWQREYLSGDVLNNKMAYWQQQLAGLQVLNLPTDHTRTPLRSSKGATAGFRLGRELTGSLERISLDNGATLYMTLLSAFNILLYKYTGQDDICVGSPVAGRQMQEVEGLIGFFVNTLVLRNRLSTQMSFREVLLQVRKTTLEAYAHQDVPFEKIVEAVVKERDMSRSPLFDVMFVFQNNAQAGNLENGLSGLSVSFEGNQDNTSKFDMSVTLRENPGGISGEINYNSDLYDPETIERMLAHYQRLLQAVVSDQDLPLDQLEMITDNERNQLLVGFNDTAAE
ncbi:condensation domain-containing protein, partial [Mucilaginibacter sp. RCC_168]|uniref:condensation domain-containing protein n=1 Tax=Mucilaginibacter sp. RCC_168 TaxID=3239221 RepID=UPI0035239ECA